MLYKEYWDASLFLLCVLVTHSHHEVSWQAYRKVIELTSGDWHLPNCKPNTPLSLADTHRNRIPFIQTPVVNLLLPRGFEAWTSACLEITWRCDNHLGPVTGKPWSSQVCHVDPMPVRCPSFNYSTIHYSWRALEIIYCYPLVPVGDWALGTLTVTQSTVLQSCVYNRAAFASELSPPFCMLYVRSRLLQYCFNTGAVLRPVILYCL